MFKTILLLGIYSLLCYSPVRAGGNAIDPGDEQPIKVEVRKNGGGYVLIRGGKPYFIKGAGGSSYPGRIAAYGGNSIRTWGSGDGQKQLDTAQKYGLTVLMGLDVARERHGFNYDDTADVRQQLERLRGEVLKYRNHPALLAWGIGNELNLESKNPKVWDAVNQISTMIHSLDHNHPTCTVLAGVNKGLTENIKTRCPDLDLLGINTYGGLATLPATLRNCDWQGPYMVTEWGPTGHWESPQTEWKRPVEETSSEKAAVYKSRYESAIRKDSGKCLGSYVFLWGQKQERTPTWYGVFTEKGEESEVVDVMQYLWTGSYPVNRAPHISSFLLNQHHAGENIYFSPGSTNEAAVIASDPGNDQLRYRWELLPEPVQLSQGGDHEDRSKPIENQLLTPNNGTVKLTAPLTEGAYRLFVYVTDGNNNVATANIPFYVRK